MALTVLDAGVIIGVLDAADAHHNAARSALRRVLDAGDALAVPASAYAECMVGPARRDADAMGAVDAFLRILPPTSSRSRGRLRGVPHSFARVTGNICAFPMRWCCATALPWPPERRS